MTFLLELRDAAKACSKIEYRQMLRDAADNVDAAFRAFYQLPNDDTLRVLNGLWSHAHAMLKNLPPEPGHSPVEGGLAGGAVLAIAA